ncbi:MAG TPA: DUF1772 domain-containing protein [Hyphomicrobiaceae bacterium]|nr:DUF1772 domain-containing protein [Hyphomicrobiaceae bacterium]
MTAKHTMLRASLVASIVFAASMFGFFFAWSVSTLWGLDQAPPYVAIQAMQDMNASVRNVCFGAAFFGTPLVLAATTALFAVSGERATAAMVGLAALVYLGGVFIVTVTVNVPLNEQLARTIIPAAVERAAEIWIAYSAPWQRANAIRTLAGGVTVLLLAAALALPRTSIQPVPAVTGAAP